MQQYALYSIKTKQSRKARLVTIMFDADAAELHADELAASFGWAAVVVKSFPRDFVAPSELPAAELL